MPSILDYYEYSKLSAAAYVNLNPNDLAESTIATAANEQERLPRGLTDQQARGISKEGDITVLLPFS